jgi:hypothetical protein
MGQTEKHSARADVFALPSTTDVGIATPVPKLRRSNVMEYVRLIVCIINGGAVAFVFISFS